MTPQARAVAAFTLAVLVITGHLNRLAFAAYAATGASLPGGQGARLVLSLLTVLVAGGVLWLAHTTVQTGVDGREASLAQAARLLATIGLIISVLATVAVLTNNQTFFGTFSLGT